MISAALRYAELGYPVFPCAPGGKAPITPHGFKDATTDPVVIEAWWAKHPDANVGMPTAGLFVIDVDGADNAWPADPELAQDLARGPVSLTPRGGRHHIFRQPEGKDWKNTASKLAPKVDTRANGGYIVVPPSVVDGKAYRWAETLELDAGPEQLPEPPDWVAAQLDGLGALFAKGASGGNGNAPSTAPFAQGAPQGATPPPDGNTIPTGQRNATLARLGGAMRRVGMSRDEILAALTQANRVRCQPPLSAREVEKIAASICRYEPDQVAVAVAENHWGQDLTGKAPNEVVPAIPDPGPLPDELLRAPGFVSEVMDYCLATAPYPNTVMAFSGALALQAVLAGRKVRDPGDNRTNLYLLGLAHSSAGKDRPRKINTEILHHIGLSSHVGGRFASGEGVQDALFVDPCMLFQTDEIDGMLQSINKAKDARHENVMGTLLTMYSSANSVFPMRRKAGKDSPGAIDQPCLVVFGTAIPNHYYEALSERMLTNGFFARMIILECGQRSPGQEPGIQALPARVLETAKWWADFRPGTGNLENWHPVPKIIPHTDEARSILIETRLEAEAEYGRAERAGDPVGTTVWGRVSEHARKLALLYAVSENPTQPEIGKAAADWARRFVVHQTRRMLFMAQAFVADNPFHAECLKFLQKLRESPERELAHSVLLKRMKTDAKNFLVLVTTLEQRGDIVIRMQSSSGRPGRFYRLAESAEDGGER
ncbi:MAG: bifunctional DNA primase/polymerase [Planctomycetota bacterium]